MFSALLLAFFLFIIKNTAHIALILPGIFRAHRKRLDRLYSVCPYCLIYHLTIDMLSTPQYIGEY